MRGAWRWRMFQARLSAKLEQRRAERAVAKFPRTKVKQKHDLPFPLVVSLTSYPARFPTLAKTLKSLLDQSVLADNTILWIGINDMASLPAEVRRLENRGLEIKACEDLRSYTKLIPSLMLFPEAGVVTADDDIYYPSDWLASLIGGYDVKNPSIVCARAHLAIIDDRGHFIPYGDWSFETSETVDVNARQRIFPTGVGGVLYPPHTLHQRVTDVSVFKSLCPTADDLWFFWMGELAGTPHRRIDGPFPKITWEASQEVGLIHENVFSNLNDVQISRLEDFFGRPIDIPNVA